MPWCLLLAVSACVTQPQFAGPMPVRNKHPAQVTVQHMPPASTSTLERGRFAARFDAAHTNMFLSGIALGRSFYMDGEYLRFGPTFRAGLGGGVEVGVEVPFAHTSGGFLDSFLIDYHDVLALPDQDRDTVPNGRFRVEANLNGGQAWRMDESGFEPLDVPLWLTWQLTAPEDGFGLAVRGGIEFPTGDDDRGYGNGGFDTTIGILTEHHWRGVAFYGHAQHTFASTPDVSDRAGLGFQDVTAIGLAAEMPLTENLHAYAQVEAETSTLRDLGLRTTEREQVMLWLGGRYRLSDRTGLEFGLGEDLRGYVSPDVTLWLGFATTGW
ncbi:MAG: DUF3187 family protein [bacterium]|nr:DUF3187 family protein [bacterium]